MMMMMIGTLSNDDDDGSENITKKMNLRPFKLYRVHLEPLNSSNVGDFSWSRILKGLFPCSNREGKIVVVCPRPHKTSHWEVSRRSRVVDVKEMY